MIKYVFAWPLLAIMVLAMLVSLLIGILAIGILSLVLVPVSVLLKSNQVINPKNSYRYGFK